MYLERQKYFPYGYTCSFSKASCISERGVILIGVDVPSVDAIEDSSVKAHKAIGENNLSILEGIVLDYVEQGLYELIALPLLLEGSDASPVRAVLKSLE